MSATVPVTCPNCEKALKVPVELAGKTIRCKDCKATIKVPTLARPATPVQAKPPEPAAPIPFMDEDDDGKVTAYVVQKDDLDIPRCPFCAKELDPPDTAICLNCGYDMLERRRHESRAVYETTTGDYFLHWLPGIIWALVIIALITVNVICWLNMSGWLEGSFLDSEEKDEITGQKKFYVKPWCFSLWISIFSAYICWVAGKFVVRRLIINWRPPEVIKKT